MKKINREVNFFSVAMLDVVTGALGAFLIITAIVVPYYVNGGFQDFLPALKEGKTLTIVDEQEQPMRVEPTLVPSSIADEGRAATPSGNTAENTAEEVVNIEALQLEVQELRVSLAEAETDNDRLGVELNSLQNQQRYYEALEEELTGVLATEGALEALTANVAQLTEERDTLSQSQEELQTELEVLEIQMATQALQMRGRESTIAQLQAHLESQENDEAATEADSARIESLQDQLTTLEEQLAGASESLEAREAALTELETEMEALTLERDTLTEQLSDLSTQQGIEDVLQARLAELEGLSETLAAREAELADAQLARDEALAQLDSLAAIDPEALANLEAQLATLTSERDTLTEQLNTLNAQQTETEALQAELVALQERLAQSADRAELAALEDQINQLTTELAQQEALEAQFQAAQAELEPLRTRLNTLLQEQAALNQQIAALQAQLQNSSTIDPNQFAALQQQLAEALYAKQQLEITLQQSQDQTNTARAELSANQLTLTSLTNQLSQAQQQLAHSQPIPGTQPLLITASWENAADIDLIVVDPAGARFGAPLEGHARSYPHRPGQLVQDTQLGPGSEIWFAPVVEPGRYTVRVNVYNPRLLKYNEFTPVNVQLIANNSETPMRNLQTSIEYYNKNCIEIAYIDVSQDGDVSFSNPGIECSSEVATKPKGYQSSGE